MLERVFCFCGDCESGVRRKRVTPGTRLCCLSLLIVGTG